MMAAEGPYIAAIIARMPVAAFNLAAYGVAFSLAWLAESPIMMLLTASNTLVRDRRSFLALRRFTYGLNAIVSATLAIGVIPPVFGFLAHQVMGLPPEIARLAHQATAVLIPWPAAIGYRRFYQGILVRHHLTRRVAYGTVVRLATMSATAGALAALVSLPGAVIGAFALSAGVIAEAAASRLMAGGVVAHLLDERGPVPGTLLTIGAITRFYFPLALTSVISLITGPLVTFFLGHSRAPIESLAVWPVVNSFVFFFRSGGIAFQEVGVALGGAHLEHGSEVRRVAGMLAGGASLALALVVFTPLADVWFRIVSGLSPELASFALPAARLMVLLPALEYLMSVQRSQLILARRTRLITTATTIEAVGLALVLMAGVSQFGLTGAVASAIALMAGRVAANGFLLAPSLAVTPSRRYP